MNMLLKERHIAAAVATVRRFGVRLVANSHYGARLKAGAWVADEGGAPEVCICGAVALADNPATQGDIIKAVARKLGITLIQAASLSDGFEDREGYTLPRDYVVDKAWFRIGRKWRRRADDVRN